MFLAPHRVVIVVAESPIRRRASRVVGFPRVKRVARGTIVAVSGMIGVFALVASAAFAGATDAPVPVRHSVIRSCTRFEPSGPFDAVTLTNADNGVRACIDVGTRVLVLLRAPRRTGPLWSRPIASPSGILEAAPMTLLLVQGETGAAFEASQRGVVQLHARRRVCPIAKSGGVSCDAIEHWGVTLAVSSFEVPPPTRSPLDTT